MALDTFAVQGRCDGTRADTVGVVSENSADDPCLLFVDDAVAGGLLAVGSQCTHHVKAKRDSTRGFAFAHAALKTAMGLEGKISDEEAAHGAFKADVQLRNLTFRNRENRNAQELHLFEESCDVFLISANAVETLGDNHVEDFVVGILQHALKVGTQVGGSADRVVRVGSGFLPAIACNQAGTQPTLIFNGGVCLKVAGISSVNGCAH